METYHGPGALLGGLYILSLSVLNFQAKYVLLILV